MKNTTVKEAVLQPNNSHHGTKLNEYRKEMDGVAKEMYDHFKGKITPSQLVEWVVRSLNYIRSAREITARARSSAECFLHLVGCNFLPVFVQPDADQEKITEELVSTLTCEDKDENYKNITAIGLSYFLLAVESYTEEMVSSMRIVSLFLELNEIAARYKTAERKAWDLEEAA